MIPLKPFRQTPSFCGPAVLKMILSYYGIERTEKQLAKLSGHTRRNGVSGEKLLKVAEKLGCEGLIKDDTRLSDVQAWLKKGVPVIVDWFSIDEGHYSIAVEIKNNMIYLQDPQLGYVRAMKTSDFKRVWFDFEPEYIHTKEDLILRRIIVIWKKK